MWALAATESASRILGILSPVDIGILLLLLAGIAVGFWTGLIWQLICLVSVIACLWVSVVYHPVVSEFFATHVSESVSNVGGGIGVFLCALLVCYLVTFLFRGLINAIKPQLPDRVLGAVFGLLVGVLIVGVFSFFVLQYSGEDSSIGGYVKDSRGAKVMAAVVRAFVYVLPDRLREGSEVGADFGLVTQEPFSTPLIEFGAS
jgi:uncharacterized membrane protein required for colicin V production